MELPSSTRVVEAADETADAPPTTVIPPENVFWPEKMTGPSNGDAATELVTVSPPKPEIVPVNAVAFGLFWNSVESPATETGPEKVSAAVPTGNVPVPFPIRMS